MIIALMPVRNAGWCLRYTLPALLQWVDAAVVLLHDCTDDTRDAIRTMPSGRVFELFDGCRDWFEASQRQRLLEVGRKIGGTHFVTLDSDEALTANLVPGIRARVEALQPGQVLDLPWLNLWRTRDAYAVDLFHVGTTPVAFGDRLDLAYPTSGYQMHHRVPPQAGYRPRPTTAEGRKTGGVLHLQALSWRRAVARQAKNKALEAARWPSYRGGLTEIDARHDRSLGLGRRVELAQVPSSWWAHGLDPALIREDEEPWEAAECRRLVAEHGPWPALNLYGVA